MKTPDIHWLGHAAFRIRAASGLEIYIDPFRLNGELPRAGLVLITHAHHDHCSPKDLALICGKNTVIAAPPSALPVLQEAGYAASEMRTGSRAELLGIPVEAVPAYNIGKQFHPRSDGNNGYILTVDGTRVYHAGDTDRIPEMKGFKADIAMLPIGGTYTMDAAEAALAAEDMKVPLLIPMHYGTHVGKMEYAQDLARLHPDGLLILPKE